MDTISKVIEDITQLDVEEAENRESTKNNTGIKKGEWRNTKQKEARSKQQYRWRLRQKQKKEEQRAAGVLPSSIVKAPVKVKAIREIPAEEFIESGTPLSDTVARMRQQLWEGATEETDISTKDYQEHLMRMKATSI